MLSSRSNYSNIVMMYAIIVFLDLSMVMLKNQKCDQLYMLFVAFDDFFLA